MVGRDTPQLPTLTGVAWLCHHTMPAALRSRRAQRKGVVRDQLITKTPTKVHTYGTEENGWPTLSQGQTIIVGWCWAGGALL